MPDPMPTSISKSEYHHYYGHSSSWAAGGGPPTPPPPGPGTGGPNSPTPTAGDLYFNDNDQGMYYFDGASWVGPMGLAAADHQTQEIIIGLNGVDSLNNVDYLGDLFNAAPPGTDHYGWQDAIASLDNNTDGGNIYCRRGTYKFSNVLCLHGTYDAIFQISQLCPNGVGPIAIEGAGQELVILQNDLGAGTPCGTFIFDSDNPVDCKRLTIRGGGKADSAPNTGSATVLIGNDGRGPSIPQNPATTSSNVHFEHVTVDAYNAGVVGNDARAVLLCNDGVISPVDCAFEYCIFENAGNSTPAANRCGCFEDNGVLAGTGSVRTSFIGCRFIAGTNSGTSGCYGVGTRYANYTNCMFAENTDCGLLLDNVMDISIDGGSVAYANAVTNPGGGLAAGITILMGYNIRISNVSSHDNVDVVPTMGWNFIISECVDVTISNCMAYASETVGNGFLIEGDSIMLNNCEANGHKNLGGTLAGCGYGFWIGQNNMANYAQVNDCTAKNNDDDGLLFDVNCNECQVVGGNYFDNALNPISVPGVGSRVFSAAGAGTQNVVIDPVAVPTTEAVHFLYN